MLLLFFRGWGDGVAVAEPLPTPYRPRQSHPQDPERRRVIQTTEYRFRTSASPSDSRFRMTDEDVL